MKKIVVVDIDGTIANIDHRLHYIKDIQNPDWDKFFKKCDKDSPIEDIVELVNMFYRSDKFIIFLTGRSQVVLNETWMWIANNFTGFRRIKDGSRYAGTQQSALVMREEGDHRPDTEVKPELLQDFFDEMDGRQFNKSMIHLILEDRDSMVKKWRELGYTCLQASDGNF